MAEGAREAKAKEPVRSVTSNVRAREPARASIARAPMDGRRSILLSPRTIQPSLRISSPSDAAELEADRVAKAVVSAPDPAPTATQRSPPGLDRAPTPAASKKAPGADPAVEAKVRKAATGGAALPAKTRGLLEPRFRANFAGVRIHTDKNASSLATQLGARAFTFGSHIFFNDSQYDPNSKGGLELLAHELTHTIQQGEAIQRKAIDPGETRVTERTPQQASRLGLSDALDFFADAANAIPGYRMFTILIGVNPINMSAVEASAANILRAIVEFLPGGNIITRVLDSYGIFDKVGGWIEGQLKSLGITASAIKAALKAFLDSLGWRDIFDLGGVWNRAKAIFTDPITRIIAFAKSLFSEILRMVREAVLKPLAALAEGTAGYPLLKAVLGFDPVTGEAVPRTADTIIGGFMTMIGQEELWQNIKKANAISRAWAWFQGALGGLMALVRSIPGRFMAALKGLEIMDFVVLPSAFVKLAKTFGSFLVDFGKWALGTVFDLAKIIIEVVAPGVMPYIAKAGAAFNTIVRDPVRFVQTLVRAAVQGFKQFAANFLTHLKASLIGWLTGALGGAGIYIPQGFSLMEIVKFVLSVMGLTWANIRAKLVKATNETTVKVLETGFDIVKTLVTQGPAAAWQKIVETLTNLKQMAIDAIMDFVKSKVVSAAVTKLLSMLSPAGALIQAIIAIYNTVMFFVERIKQIAAVAASFIDSIATIAAGNIGPAANRVEQTMAGLLTLVISFLARIAGLGKVSDAVVGLINKIRAPIDKALDKVVDWIVATAKKLGKMAKEGAAAIFDWWKEKLGFSNADGESHTLQFIGTGDSAKMGIATTLTPVATYLANHPDKGKPVWNTANSVFSAATQVIYSPAAKTQAEKDRRAAIKAELAKVSAAFAKLSGAPPDASDYGTNTPPTYGNPCKVDVIIGAPLTGSITGAWPVNMKGYKEIYDAGLTTATDRWVQMHIISEKLGGDGTNFANLVPAPNSVNTGPFRSFEHAIGPLAKAKSGAIKNRVWVEVSVSGSKTAATGVSGKAGLWLWKGKKASPKWMKSETASFTASAGIPKPQLGAKRKLVLNFTSGTEMTKDFGISSATATLVKQGRPYASVAAFKATMLANGATIGQINAVLARGPALNGP
ncbi:hypothetical protein GCM10009087_47440 [Sphingomonas oligophenolica]|uniref:DUF4157 domain-containing protein n=1 Tax=Sphingomonas oligophenolica TaxID=301154 RepID=A0ABU9Y7A3_9SPHN